MFLDTANIKDIDKYFDYGCFEGITTNPVILKRNNMDVKLMLEYSKDRNIPLTFIQINGTTHEEMMRFYEEHKACFSENVGMKIPLSDAGIKTFSKIKDKRIPSIGTVCYTTHQAIVGALSDFDIIAVYYNRIEELGGDAKKLISELRKFIDDQNLDTKIMAAAFKNAHQVKDAYVLGAHTCTVSPQIFALMIQHRAMDLDIEVFSQS